MSTMPDDATEIRIIHDSAALLAEVRSLRARLAECERERDAERAAREKAAAERDRRAQHQADALAFCNMARAERDAALTRLAEVEAQAAAMREAIASAIEIEDGIAVAVNWPALAAVFDRESTAGRDLLARHAAEVAMVRELARAEAIRECERAADSVNAESASDAIRALLPGGGA